MQKFRLNLDQNGLAAISEEDIPRVSGIIGKLEERRSSRGGTRALAGAAGIRGGANHKPPANYSTGPEGRRRPGAHSPTAGGRALTPRP